MSARLNSSLCSAALLAVFTSVAVYAATPVELQKARHDHYHELGDAFKALRDESKAATPDFAAMEKAAEIVNKASINQQQWFPKGTGPDAGKTRALPEVWTKPAEFDAAAKKLSDAAPKLLAAVKSKDLDAVNAAFKEAGGSCKNCHDNFRSPEEH